MSEEHSTKSGHDNVLAERQAMLAHHCKLVARKLNHALFVFGSQGGLGKTRTVLGTLEEESQEVVLINSHVTVLAFFKLLFKHRDDDARGVNKLRRTLWPSIFELVSLGKPGFSVELDANLRRRG